MDSFSIVRWSLVKPTTHKLTIILTMHTKSAASQWNDNRKNVVYSCKNPRQSNAAEKNRFSHCFYVCLFSMLSHLIWLTTQILLFSPLWFDILLFPSQSVMFSSFILKNIALKRLIVALFHNNLAVCDAGCLWVRESDRFYIEPCGSNLKTQSSTSNNSFKKIKYDIMLL